MKYLYHSGILVFNSLAAETKLKRMHLKRRFIKDPKFFEEY